MIRKAEEMDLFKLAHSLTLDVYRSTERFPPEERFGLSAQMRRSAYSIPINVVEGASRLSRKEYRQFVGMARGSASEITYQLLLSRDLGYISEENYASLGEGYNRVSRMLTGLIKSLKEQRGAKEDHP